MSKIRQRFVALSEECETLCHNAPWLGSDSKTPNFRLLYSSVESYEAGNGIAIMGMNPAGGPKDALTDDPARPFKDPEYSAYLDDEWSHHMRGQSPLQRAVQGIAMILTGSGPSDVMTAITNENLTPENRIGAGATALLRNSPSGNIIPYRGSDLKKIPPQLREHGESVGWQLLCLVRPKPQFIITLANSINSLPWSTILNGSKQQFQRECPDTWVYRGYKRYRKYREVRLTGGPLKGTIVIGLPAVVHDKVDDDITPRLFEILAKRVQHHGLTFS